jgi:hypothetical protein
MLRRKTKMQLRTFVIFVVTLIVVGCTVSSAKSRGSISSDKDPITGQWTGTFEVQGHTVEVTFDLKLDGDKVSGKLDSAHTGPGTLKNGTWMHNRINFTAEFTKHESIEIVGTLKDGKLSGEFQTEGTTGKWEAKKN